MKLRRKSVLWTWVGSYLLVLLIPLVTVFINYQMNCNTIKKELVRVNQLSLDNAADNINRYLDLMRKNYTYVFLNSSFESLQKKNSMDTQFYNNTKELQDQLYNYRNSTDKMFCMIYLKNKDYIVTSENSCSAESYYQGMMYTYKDFIDYESWKQILSAEHSEEYLVSRGVNYWTPGESLIYANTIKGTWKEKYNVLVSIPLSIIEDATGYLKEDSWMLINIEGMEPLVFHGGKLTEAPEWVEREEFFVRLQSQSISPDISYELVFSEQSIMNELQGVRNTFWISLVITLILAIAGIVVLVRINYRPVHSIMSEIDEKEELTGKNEFEELKNSYLKIKKEKHSSQQLVEKQKKELMNSMLLTMMKGRSVKLYEEEKKEYLGLALKGNIALVGFMFPIGKRDMEYEELQFFIVHNIFSELMQKEKFYHVEDGYFMFYLFELQTDMEEEWRQEVLKQVEYTCALLYDKWEISVLGVVGEIGEGIDVIKGLYQNIMDAFEYGKVVGGQNTIDVRMLPNYDEFRLVEEYMDKGFRDAFAAKDADGACAILDKVFAPQNTAAVNIAIAKIHAYEAFNIVMDIFREYVTDIVQQEAAISYLELLIKAQTIEEINGHFHELLRFQIAVVSRQQMQEGKGIVSKVMKYVEANYADYNLNLSSMAEGLGKNSRYISRVFKEETQMGILDYINSVRIKKARELMAEGEYTTEEMAAMVGYGNIRSFRRAFVKITGEMPSTYMEH